jgi:hypothetical protein
MDILEGKKLLQQNEGKPPKFLDIVEVRLALTPHTKTTVIIQTPSQCLWGEAMHQLGAPRTFRSPVKCTNIHGC